MLNNLKIINEFVEGGVRFIDVLVLDIGALQDVISDLEADIIKSMTAGNEGEADKLALILEIVAPLIDSIAVTGYEYLRINTSNMDITGIGLNLQISADFVLFDMPMSIKSKGTGFIKIIYT
jgi:hypothetical protein